MKFILGTKQYMTQVFDDEGRVQPVTMVAAGPVVVTQIKTQEKDGYRAVQFGYSQRRLKNINKPQRKLGWRYLREERIAGEMPKITTGQTLDVSVFAPGDVVDVSSTSKGKGFQGVVKRHGFHGGPRTHGQKHAERKPGSIGSGLRTRVPKGMRMAGRLGGRRVTVKNLRVLKIDKENNQLVIAGAIPGRRGTLLEIRQAKKLKAKKLIS
jgi:large subunit ribosomal protein L3